MHHLTPLPSVYSTKVRVVKQESPPVLNKMVPKANIEAMSSNIDNLVDPATVALVPKEWDTSGSLAAVNEGTTTVSLEPSSLWNRSGRPCQTPKPSDSEEPES